MYCIHSLKASRSRIAARLLPVLSPVRGAIDLASIMVGVIVIGLISGVIAATVFAVIPWAQDEVAKGTLDSVRTAQSVHLAQSSNAGAGTYALTANELVSAGLLQQSDTVTFFVTGASANGYTATAVSKSGTTWRITASNPTPVRVEPVDASAPTVTFMDGEGVLTGDLLAVSLPAGSFNSGASVRLSGGLSPLTVAANPNGGLTATVTIDPTKTSWISATDLVEGTTFTIVSVTPQPGAGF